MAASVSEVSPVGASTKIYENKCHQCCVQQVNVLAPPATANKRWARSCRAIVCTAILAGIWSHCSQVTANFVPAPSRFVSMKAGKAGRSALGGLLSTPLVVGVLRHTEPAKAVIIQLPFSAPWRFDDTIFTLLSVEAVTIVVISVFVALFVREQISAFERDTAGGKLAEGARNAARSLGAQLSEVPTLQWFKLFLCIVIDIVGNSGYLLPSLDFFLASFEGIALKFLFGGNVLAVLGFIEELIPFSEILPTATVAWVLQTLAPDNVVTRLLGIQPWRMRQKDTA